MYSHDTIAVRWIGVWCLLILCPGCFTYRTVSLDSTRPGMEIRAQLLDDGAEKVREVTRGPDRRSIDGTIVRLDGETVLLSVLRTDLLASTATRPGRIEVPLHRRDISAMEERRISKARTLAAAGGATVGLYILVRALFDGAGGLLPGFGGGEEI